MNRMYLKRRKKKLSILNILVILFVLIIILLVYLFKIFNDKASPQLINYSKIETKRIVSSVINATVLEETYKNSNIENLFITSKNNQGYIENIDFNPKYVNQILVDVYKSVEKNLTYLENGDVEKLNLSNVNISKYNSSKLKKGIIYEIPSGIILNNVILNNIFPKIPVKMNLIGNIFCRLTNDVKSYGINNALITVNVEVEVEVKILLPFVSENTKIIESVPILIKIIEGNVPSYYFGGYLSSPYISNSVQ